MATAREILITLHNKFNGDWGKIYEAISTKSELGDLDLTNSENLITIVDSEYPSELKAIYMPPFVITKEDAKIKTFRVSITYEFEAYTQYDADLKVMNFDLDLDNIVKTSKAKQV